MRIGVDLDNTILCYGPLFHRVAVARNLVPPTLAPSKNVIKSWIQRNLGDPEWTALQAEVYGPLLEGAVAYPGAFEFFKHCRSAGIETRIISHKSQFPALGARTDLRVAAVRWFEKQGWFGSALEPDPTFLEFHDTRREKVEAIARNRCDIFIDDLPEVLSEENFPSTTTPLLFDPENAHSDHKTAQRVSDWREIEAALLSNHPA